MSDGPLPEEPAGCTWRRRIKHRWAYGCGRLLIAISLNRIEPVVIDGRSLIGKHRCWYAAALVWSGNFYLRWLKSQVQMLAPHEWQKREATVYRHVYGAELATDSRGGLVLPEWPGKSLKQHLESEDGLGRKLRAVRSAVRALRHFHSIGVRGPDGRKQSLSHGDATAANVQIDAKGEGRWFDFEMVHNAEMPADWRHADDLRALTYSAARYFTTQCFGVLARTVVRNYPRPGVLATLAGAIGHWRRHPIAFHLAQAPLAYGRRDFMDAALLQALRRERSRRQPSQVVRFSRTTRHGS